MGYQYINIDHIHLIHIMDTEKICYELKTTVTIRMEFIRYKVAGRNNKHLYIIRLVETMMIQLSDKIGTVEADGVVPDVGLQNREPISE